MTTGPQTKAEAAAEKAAWQARQRALYQDFDAHGNPGQVLHSAVLHSPTAWKSIPDTIRFAVWLWAVTFIVGALGAAVALVVWGAALLALLSQQ
jgi:hypothetical protein